jgi:SPP1 family predicted phage head-tail adaptor
MRSYTDRFKFEAKTVAQDSEGQPVETWSEWLTVWGKVRVLSATEFPDMYKPNVRSVAEFKTRYRKDTETVDYESERRIVWRGKYWNIAGIIPDHSQPEMTLHAVRTE